MKKKVVLRKSLQAGNPETGEIKKMRMPLCGGLEIYMDIVQYLNGKKILIWGYGREGKSTEKFLSSYCTPASVAVYEGPKDGIAEEDYDLIIKSPGIPMLEFNPKYTSQTELFLGQFKEQVIGVTGTKGKSTTATMLHHVLAACSGHPTLLLGNIGLPCLDYYGEMTADTLVVFELSCHQLFHTKVSPHVGVILNIFEEHLDYYKTMENYVASKHAIAKYQTVEDFLYCGAGVDLTGVTALGKRTVIAPVRAKKYELRILGEQNQYNAEFVYRIATEVYGCDGDDVKKALGEVGNLPHRLELVGEVGGVRYYDDSIATIPEAVICAVAAIEKVQTVIIGGMDRGIDYNVLEGFVKENPQYTYIFMYDTGKRIWEELGGISKKLTSGMGATDMGAVNTDVVNAGTEEAVAADCANRYLVATLEEAVALAKKMTAPGMACVMSPAAPSYGVFKNFEERGEKFKEYVMK